MGISLNSLGLQSTTSTSAVGPARPIHPAEAASAVREATQVEVSKGGQLLAALKQLKEQSPAELKSVAASLAQEVRTQAQSESGKAQEGLSRFAERLDAVASTGDLSVLQPRLQSEQARGAKGYVPPPSEGLPSDQGGDEGSEGSANAAVSEVGASGPRGQVEGLMTNLLKHVNAATRAMESGSSTEQTSSETGMGSRLGLGAGA